MKKLLVFLVALPLVSAAQEKKKMQSYTVHEDQVRPSMVVEYESACKDLVALMKQHGIGETQWLTAATNDFRYWYVSPVSSMADLDKSPFKTLTEKVGEEKMNAIWSRMDKCYDRHGTYLVRLDEELSYQPGGIDQNPADQPWREYHFWHVAPANLDAAVDIAKKIKALCESQKSPVYYRVYRNSFGTMGPYFLVAFAATDGAAFEKESMEARKAFGEEYARLHAALRGLTIKYEETQGMIRNDLSYKPAANAGTGTR